jgi:hypothetical protein
MSISADGRLYFRTGAHLLRFVLLDVDETLPCILSESTPTKPNSEDLLSNHAIDDFDG